VAQLLPPRTAAQCAALADVPGVRVRGPSWRSSCRDRRFCLNARLSNTQAALDVDAALPGGTWRYPALAAHVAEAAAQAAASRVRRHNQSPRFFAFSRALQEPTASGADGDGGASVGGAAAATSSGEGGPHAADASAQPSAVPRVVGRRTPLQRRGPPASLSAGATAALLVALSPAAQAAQAAASGPAPPSGARRGANSASSGERTDRGAGRPPLPPSSAARAALHGLASPRRAPAQAAGADNGDASPAGGGRKRVRNLFGSRNEASAHDALLMMSAVASPASGSERTTPGGGGARRAQPGSGARRGRVGFARCRRRKPLPEAQPPAAGAPASVGGSRDAGSYVFRFDAAAAGEDAALLVPPPPPPPSAAEALAAALRGAGSGSGVVATAADAAAGAARVAAALQRCSRARRWARAEWHCPPLDAPFFGRSDFRDWLDHAGLGDIARLPRRDWRAVRAPLGAPRRLSLAFLRAEREALELQRATSREAYSRLQRAGGLGAPTSATSRSHALPPGVPPPMAVGARVLALHPRSRCVAAGAVLTVEPSRLRVQFDRWDLGVEFCADTAVAPLRPGAMPASHYASAAAAADPVGAASKMTSAALHADDDVAWAAGVMASGGRGRPSAAAGGARGTPSARALYSDHAPRHAAAAPFAPVASPMASRAALAAAAAAAERTETAAAMASLSLALDRKEALLCELRQMNAEAAQMQAAAAAAASSGPRAGDDAFARAYAEVVLALKDANAAVEAGLTRLRGGQGGATPAAAGRAAGGGGGTPGGAARLVAESAADASKLVAETAAAAAAEPSPSPALAPSPAIASRAALAGPLVAAAVAALLVVRQLADAPGQLPAADVAAALSEAADALRPRAAANGPLFDALRASLQELTEQLTTVYAA
jgi:hypothetical protein